MSASRSIRLFINDNLTPQARSRALANFARQDVARLQREGRAALSFTVFVDGRENAPLESVRPEGRIVYRFNGLSESVAFALGFLLARSPVLSGAYRKSWFVLVDGLLWRRDFQDIPAGSEVSIVNTQPYHRKIDMGSQGAGSIGREVANRRKAGTSRKRGAYVSIVEAARQETMKRFPGVFAERVFLELPSGPAPAPYQMRGGMVNAGRVGAPRNGRFRAGMKFSAAGSLMTYPALVMRWGGYLTGARGA
jgi:hypothetical protein